MQYLQRERAGVPFATTTITSPREPLEKPLTFTFTFDRYHHCHFFSDAPLVSVLSKIIATMNTTYQLVPASPCLAEKGALPSAPPVPVQPVGTPSFQQRHRGLLLGVTSALAGVVLLATGGGVYAGLIPCGHSTGAKLTKRSALLDPVRLNVRISLGAYTVLS